MSPEKTIGCNGVHHRGEHVACCCIVRLRAHFHCAGSSDHLGTIPEWLQTIRSSSEPKKIQHIGHCIRVESFEAVESAYLSSLPWSNRWNASYVDDLERYAQFTTAITCHEMY